MPTIKQIGHQLYTGQISYNFIARRRRWYIVSAIVILVSIGSLAIRGLDLGIEFKGGVEFQVKVATVNATTVDDYRSAVQAANLPAMADVTVTTIGTDQVRVQTRSLSVDEVVTVRDAIAKKAGVADEQVAYSSTGPSWGKQISQRALIALLVFLVLVTIVIWATFRNWKMSVAALIALVHDLVITVGIYALVGFSVAPATVIGVLTILGYSLYDTVVVFDKVRENSRGITANVTRTYSEAANLAVNQVLVRSLNTTLIGVLPVSALLFAGAFILGEGPLKDLALALFVGMICGAYSSIFIATPLLAQMREREPQMAKLRRRVENRRAKLAGRSEPHRLEDEPAKKKVAAGRYDTDELAAAEAEVARLREYDVDVVRTGAPTSVETPLRTLGLSVDRPPTAKPASPGPASADDVPIRDSGAARRPQPQRKPRSERKK